MTDLTRLEASARLYRYLTAYAKDDLVGMIDAVGLEAELVETMTLGDTLDALIVRASDLAKLAGVTTKGDAD